MIRNIGLILLLIFTLTSCSNNSDGSLTIACASSLKSPLEEIEILYEDKYNLEVELTFGGSGTLRTQIENGAPVDLFFSANSKDIDSLQNRGIIKAEDRFSILENIVVLIANPDIFIESIEELSSDKVKRIATTQYNAAAIGRYTEEALKYYGLFDEVSSKFVNAPNVSSVLNWVETKNSDVGFVYKTDALNSENIIIIQEIDKEATESILYEIGVLSNSENYNVALEFISFLKSEQSKVVFNKYGFIALD